jgi:hypothetical protein
MVRERNKTSQIKLTEVKISLNQFDEMNLLLFSTKNLEELPLEGVVNRISYHNENYSTLLNCKYTSFAAPNSMRTRRKYK